MEDKIKDNIDNPRHLEELYQAHRQEFSKAFLEIYEDIKAHPIAEFWKARLDFEQPSVTAVLHHRKDILILVLTCLATGVLIKLPQILNFDPEKYFFYQANTGLIVFFGLNIYAFLSNNDLNLRHLSITLYLSGCRYLHKPPAME
ncbi:MAG: hypothetical protein OER04_18875 [Cyclobacteriaceae bacterium]|nr:hypothetical protein [Cyclobacteriaceae bacterium]